MLINGSNDQRPWMRTLSAHAGQLGFLLGTAMPISSTLAGEPSLVVCLQLLETVG